MANVENFPVNPQNNNNNQMNNGNFPQNQPQNNNNQQNNNFPQNQPLNNNFVQNQPQMNQFNQNQMQFMMNPNMMPMMNPQQQQIQFELAKRQAFEMGRTLKQQKEMMERIMYYRNQREERRKTGEIVIFFNYKKEYDILPITLTADKLILEALNEYIEQSQKQNVKFKFKGKELKLDDTSGRRLHELEGLVSGEEIIVEDAQ
jgi:hypothetical protein